jgi:hypothetical protein
VTSFTFDIGGGGYFFGGPDKGADELVLSADFISLSASSVASDATIGTVVGTLSVTAAYSGTPQWALTDDANACFAVNSSTGVVTVANDISGLDVPAIKARVRNILPKVFSRTFQLTVTGGGGGLPDPPAGFAYIVNADGKYVVNADSAYILAKI